VVENQKMANLVQIQQLKPKLNEYYNQIQLQKWNKLKFIILINFFKITTFILRAFYFIK
jgi:hypothetical protein